MVVLLKPGAGGIDRDLLILLAAKLPEVRYGMVLYVSNTKYDGKGHEYPGMGFFCRYGEQDKSGFTAVVRFFPREGSSYLVPGMLSHRFESLGEQEVL